MNRMALCYYQQGTLILPSLFTLERLNIKYLSYIKWNVYANIKERSKILLSSLKASVVCNIREKMIVLSGISLNVIS